MRLTLNKDLGPLKERALAEIDNRAGVERQAILTSIPGQEDLYRRKLEEALQGTGPYLLQEATINGISVQEQARIILDRDAECEAKLLEIERRRIIAKKAVREATTPAGIEAV